MSMMQANQTFFHDGGMEHGGTQRAEDDPMVVRFPAFYDRLDEPEELAEPVKRGPGRPPGSRNKPKATEDGTADG